MPDDPFPSAALDANRSGHLTPDQATLYRHEAASDRRNALFAGLAVIGFGTLVIVGAITGRAPGGRLETLLIGVALLAVGLVVAYFAGIRGSKAKAAAVAAGTVTMIEGPFGRDRRDRRDSLDDGSTHYSPGNEYEYYLLVGDRRFTVSEQQWEAAPEDGIVRVYLLGGSDRIVNLEKVAEAPQQVPAIVRAALDRAAASSDPDVAAQAQAMLLQAEAMTGGRSTTTAAAPPAGAPAGAPAEPLEKAILGTWRSDLARITYEFRPDGLAVATSSKGESREQRWNADGPQDLRLDGEVLHATVDGDELSMGEPPHALVFRRADRT